MTTSKTQSSTTPTPSLSEAIREALTTFEYNDLTGGVRINVADALFAIAAAINRLAITQEALVETQQKAGERSAQHFDTMMAVIDASGNRPGHA
jgi:hypothetical protein